MKKNKEESLRWFDQAMHDFEVAENNSKAGFYSDACFMYEQSVQKALKAYLISQGNRYVLEHSIQELAKLCMKYENAFKDVIEMGMILDRYYITTRYPNALAPPAIPYKSYTEKDGSEARKIAIKIIEIVKKSLFS